MAELGALSLRIETTGDAAVLRTLDAIDTKAKRTDISLVNTVAALNKLGIAARQVGGSIQVADGQLEQATQIVRRLGSQAQVTAGNLAQLGAVTSKAAAAASPQLQVFGRDLVQTSGKLTAFGKSGLNAFNAISFGLAQMAATGQTSFRSLATSAASVLAFFGPQGAIAAAVIATGLVLIEFFRRQKKEITELAALMERATKDAMARRERDDPVGVAEERLAGARKVVAAFDEELNRLIEIRNLRQISASEQKVFEAQLAAVQAKKAIALQQEFEFLRQVNDARASLTKGLPEVKVTGKSNQALEQERRKAIADEIAALASLNQARGTTAVELLRLIRLEGTLIDELARGSVTKEREAGIWEQIAKARKAAAAAIPTPAIRPITPATPQPVAPGQLARPTGALAEFLSPERIAADVAAADKAMAERVAAFNFNETQTALSEVLGNAIASGIAFGFAHGLGEGGIGEGFKQMAAQLAAGLGSVAIDYGIKAILTAQAMAKIAAFLIANPILAIGAGIALVALGRAMGGRHGAGRSFGGGGSGFSGSSGQQSSVPLSIRRLVVDPNAALRQQAAGRMSGMADATVAPSPLAGVTLLEVKSPRGTEVIGSSYDAYQRRRR